MGQMDVYTHLHWAWVQFAYHFIQQLPLCSGEVGIQLVDVMKSEVGSLRPGWGAILTRGNLIMYSD
eukprot:scaffold23167_cov21-Prasinocladus_malaysianus.AAC.1